LPLDWTIRSAAVEPELGPSVGTAPAVWAAAPASAAAAVAVRRIMRGFIWSLSFVSPAIALCDRVTKGNSGAVAGR
jgi:hypothetical protein